MQNFGQNDRGDNFFLCPRCGTVKVDAFGQHGDKVYVPALVERCRKFAAEFWGNEPTTPPIWWRLGIAESINLPGERT
jgi:hypothetical protein